MLFASSIEFGLSSGNELITKHLVFIVMSQTQVMHSSNFNVSAITGDCNQMKEASMTRCHSL